MDPAVGSDHHPLVDIEAERRDLVHYFPRLTSVDPHEIALRHVDRVAVQVADRALLVIDDFDVSGHG